MPKNVFISHAGSDSLHAKTIADLLQDENINVRIDRKEINAGDSFLSFMEDSLSTSDYCLLLWSKDASVKSWVRVEWEAALYKSVQESRSFIIVGRLEAFPVPALLGPRLMVDLFPDYEEGIRQLKSLWVDDLTVETLTSRPVSSSEVLKQIGSGGETIYVTSELFAKSVPVKLDLEEPVVLIIDRIIDKLNFPRDLSFNNLFGLRLTYNLIHNSKVLDRALSLAAQGVHAKDVIWLETNITQYAHSQQIQREGTSTTYRSGKTQDVNINRYAQSYLLDLVAKNKLGF